MYNVEGYNPIKKKLNEMEVELLSLALDLENSKSSEREYIEKRMEALKQSIKVYRGGC